MKKIIFVALLATELLRAESGFYLGIDGGITGAVFETEIPSLSYSESEKSHGSSETFKMGYYLRAPLKTHLKS
jgi:hypothetical protein